MPIDIRVQVASETLENLPDEYLQMLDVDLALALERFVEKAADYPPDGYKFLGSKGQVSDIARKFFKLKAAIWDGQRLDGEQPDEIINDLLGHLIILMACRREGI